MCSRFKGDGGPTGAIKIQLSTVSCEMSPLPLLLGMGMELLADQ